MRVVLALLITLGVSTPLLTATPAQALEQGNLGKITPQHQTIKKSFGPMAGVYPANGKAEFFLEFRPQTCSNVTYCDSFELDVSYPKSFERTTFFGVSVTLDWKNQQTAKNPNGNHLTLFLWGDNTSTGPPASTCQTPEDTKCANLSSETISVTEPDDTTRLDPPTPLYFTVVNASGVNTGYTITAHWYTFALPPAPEFHPPQIGVSNQNVSGPTNATPPLPTLAPLANGATAPRKILVPGPDGKLHEITLPGYAAGAKLTANDTKPRSPWIPAFIAGAIVLIGLSAYLVYRARQQDRAANEF